MKTSAVDFIPETSSLPKLKEAVDHCQGCDLYLHATQGVFGEGSTKASIVLVGEQPGDQEDLVGRPFVGPAGTLLDQCLEEAGISRKDVYVTNAVKHFKFTPSGKRRLHKKPSARELTACRPWLQRELEIIEPEVLICMGASAAQTLFGSMARVTKQRGQRLQTAWSEKSMMTWHPSAVLRAPDADARHRMRAELVGDFRTARSWLED